MDSRSRSRSRSRSQSRSRSRSITPRSRDSLYSRSPSPQRSRRDRSFTRSASPASRRNGRYRSRSDSRDRSLSRGRSDSPLRGSTKIVVERLTKAINADHLHEIFGQYGRIRDLEIPMNRQFNTNRGIAYILFEEEADAEAAIAHMHEAQVDGAVINVSIVLPRRKFSPSPPTASRGANIDPRQPDPRAAGARNRGGRGAGRGPTDRNRRGPRPQSPRRHGSHGGRHGGRNHHDSSRSRSRSRRRERSRSFDSHDSRSFSPPRRQSIDSRRGAFSNDHRRQ